MKGYLHQSSIYFPFILTLYIGNAKLEISGGELIGLNPIEV